MICTVLSSYFLTSVSSLPLASLGSEGRTQVRGTLHQASVFSFSLPLRVDGDAVLAHWNGPLAPGDWSVCLLTHKCGAFSSTGESAPPDPRKWTEAKQNHHTAPRARVSVGSSDVTWPACSCGQVWTLLPAPVNRLLFSPKSEYEQCVFCWLRERLTAAHSALLGTRECVVVS